MEALIILSAHVELKKYAGGPVDAIVLLLHEGEKDSDYWSSHWPIVSAQCDVPGIIRDLAERRDFTGKRDEIFRVPVVGLAAGQGSRVRNIYLAGLGGRERKDRASDSEVLRNVLTSTLRTVGEQRNESALVLIADNADNAVNTSNGESLSLSEILGESVELCGYDFDKYKSKDKASADNSNSDDFALKTVYVLDLDEAAVAKGQLYAAMQSIARDWDNEPGCVINPPVMAEIAQSVAKECGLECEVWDEERLKAERMGAILAVGGGSKTPPRLVHLTWRPEKVCNNAKVKKVALVGKGITFDSGGINLKPGKWLRTMKGDKSGVCIMLAVMRGVAKLNLPIEVHAILPMAENMPSGSAYRPDDIVRARNGKTIEIDDTDAEGRVLLSDALSLASELHPDVMIDTATLTGACAVGLGQWRTGLFANDDALADALLRSSRRRGEELWRLPEWDVHLEKELKSPIADLINVAKPREGDAIFAAMFLSNFVGEKIAWAHLDIAGSDFVDKEWGVYAKGASCFGVRLILDCIEYLAACN